MTEEAESNNALELEHIIGFSGSYLRSATFHPKNSKFVVYAMGSMIVIEDITDPHNQNFLMKHDDPISTFVVGSKYIASAQIGSTKSKLPIARIIVWDVKNLKPLYILDKHLHSVTSLSFSHDEKFLASTSENCVAIWDMENGSYAAGYTFPSTPSFVAWGPKLNDFNLRRPKYKLICGNDQGIKIMDYSFEVMTMQFALTGVDVVMSGRISGGFTRTYHSCALSEDGVFAYVGTKTGEVIVINVPHAVIRTSLQVAVGGALSMSLFGDKLFVGGGDGKVTVLQGNDKVWNAIGSTQLEGAATTVCVDKEGKSLLCGTDRGRMYFLDSQTLKIDHFTASHTDSVEYVSFNKKDSEHFASASKDGSLIVWNLSDYSIEFRCKEPNAKALCCIFLADNKILSGWDDGFIRMYDAVQKKLLWQVVNAHKGGITALAHSEKFFCTGGNDGILRIWTNQSHELMGQFQDQKKPIVAIAVDPVTPNIIHTCGQDKAVITYDLAQNKRLTFHALSGGLGGWSALSQKHDGEREIACSFADGKIYFWDIDYADPVDVYSQKAGTIITHLEVSPSGRFLALCAKDCTISVYDMKTEEKGGVVVGEGTLNSTPTCLSWSPDEKQIVAVCVDSSITVWNFYAN